MRQIVKDINTLKEDDLVTIILFCLYKMTGDPEYATISELAYTLDRNSMYNLCATFGGTTIKIPTLKEYKDMISIMLAFNYVHTEKMSFEDACRKANVDPFEESTLKMYDILEEVFESYEF